MRSTADLVRTAIRVEIARQNSTQAKIAAASGKSDAWLSSRLAGSTSITTDDIDTIAAGLGMTPSDLIRAALAERSAA